MEGKERVRGGRRGREREGRDRGRRREEEGGRREKESERERGGMKGRGSRRGRMRMTDAPHNNSHNIYVPHHWISAQKQDHTTQGTPILYKESLKL